MSTTKLAVAVALLLSATSAALAQGPQCYGDRPYYGSESAGWLDSNYHPGIDCDIATCPCAFRRTRLAKRRRIGSNVRHRADRMGGASGLGSFHALRRVRDGHHSWCAIDLSRCSSFFDRMSITGIDRAVACLPIQEINGLRRGLEQDVRLAARCPSESIAADGGGSEKRVDNRRHLSPPTPKPPIRLRAVETNSSSVFVVVLNNRLFFEASFRFICSSQS